LGPRNLPATSGALPVASRLQRIAGGTQAQIFYPAAPDAKPSQRDYMPKAKAEGLGALAGKVGKFVAPIIMSGKSPTLEGEPAETKLPVVLFSHGLLGSCEMYTQTCREIASQGYMVVALEHEDSSAFIAFDAKGEPILYDPLPDGGDNSKCVALRMPKLRQRANELQTAVDWIRSGGAGVEATDLLIAGHSFGAAGIVVALDMLPAGTFKGAILYDMWTAPLAEEVLMKKMPTHTPSVNILGEEFGVHCGDTVRARRTKLFGGTAVPDVYIHGAKHHEFSDFPFLVPEFMYKNRAVTRAASAEITRVALEAFSAGKAVTQEQLLRIPNVRATPYPQ